MQVGFVAVERVNENLYYMEKLAVFPAYRYKGYGGELVKFVCNHVRHNKGKELSIGIINEHEVLKTWYKVNGFIETAVKKFEHQPFTVYLMEKAIT